MFILILQACHPSDTSPTEESPGWGTQADNDPAAVGRILGVDQSTDVELGIALSTSAWAPRTYTQVFVGDAAAVDFSEAPLVWADSELCPPRWYGFCWALDQAPPDSGWFTESPRDVGDDFYQDGAVWSFQVDPYGTHEQPEPYIAVTLPAAAHVVLPTTLRLGESIPVDVADQGFSGLVGVVVDSSGAETWSSQPLDVDTFLAATGETVAALVVPAEAFPAEGTYGVGIAATVRFVPSEYDLLDSSVSAILTGHMQFSRVEVSQ